MSDLLERGAAFLAAKQKSHASREVVYQRDTATVTVRATIGRTEFAVESGMSVVEAWESRDFLIAAADLVLDGAATLPERGDRIVEGVYAYAVLAPAGQPHFRFSDLYRKVLRIHTKLVEKSDG